MLKEIARPTGVLAEDKLTFPLKPFTLASVILEAANEPCGNVRFRGLPVRMKSCPTTSFTLVVFVSGPLVPVKLRLYSPEITEEATVTFKTDVADCPLLSVKLGGEKAVVTPARGLAERSTVPLKVFRLVNVMLAVLAEPCSMASWAGFGLRLNPGFFTTTATLVVWETEPTVAFTRMLYVPTAVAEGTLTLSEAPDVPPAASDTLLELNNVPRPPDGVAVRFAVPENPLTLVSEMVDIADDPRTIAIELGADDILKPFTTKVPTMN